VKHDKTYANISEDEDIFSIGLNRAVTLIEEKKANPGKGRRGADPGKELGEHPQKGGKIVAKNGRYGPYVSHDGVNANLPTDKTPDTITLDEAAALIDARPPKSGGSSARRKRPARGESATKAAAAPKAPAKAKAAKAEAKPKKRAAASSAKAPSKSKKAKTPKAEAAE
jgi:DNA topoisomerase-1